MSAEVGSGEPLRCQTPRQRYFAWIHILPYTESQLAKARETISSLPVWKEMLRCPPSLIDTPLLLRMRFSGVPFQIVQNLEHVDPTNDFGSVEAECSCPDRTRGWCKHVAALCLALVEFCESKPTQMLDGLGISLLDIEAEERKAAARLLGKRVGEEWPFSPSTSSKRISLSRTDGLPSSSEKHPILLE